VKVLPNEDYSRLARIGATGADVPITLTDACRDVFNDAISVATLMAEHHRGNLVIYKIGRQYFTTLNEVNAMMEKCRVQALPHRASGNSPVNLSDEGARAARTRAALAALTLSVDKRKAARRKKIK
jgi:hypothetical protein